MIYMTPQGRPPKHIRGHPSWGQMMSPAMGITTPVSHIWCADNQAYSGQLNWKRYHHWLTQMTDHLATCSFVTVPDVLGNATATLDRFRYYAWRIRALGYNIALVAQDGLESLPWPPATTYDTLFIGGHTAWKMSHHAAHCIHHALTLSKQVHIGRVNSHKRIRHFRALGAHSCDGTAVCFEPTRTYRTFTRVLTEPWQPDLLSTQP